MAQKRTFNCTRQKFKNSRMSLCATQDKRRLKKEKKTEILRMIVEREKAEDNRTNVQVVSNSFET